MLHPCCMSLIFHGWDLAPYGQQLINNKGRFTVVIATQKKEDIWQSRC